MDEIKIPVDRQKLIIQNNLTVLNDQIYDATINRRVAVIAKDEALQKRCDDTLAVLLKKRDEFEKILKEVEVEK
jgi:hypothetical protein